MAFIKKTSKSTSLLSSLNAADSSLAIDITQLAEDEVTFTEAAADAKQLRETAEKQATAVRGAYSLLQSAGVEL